MTFYVKYHNVKSPYLKHWFWLTWLGIPTLIAIIWSIINQMDATFVLFSLIIAYFLWVLLSPIYLLIYKQIIALIIKSRPSQYMLDMPQTLILNNERVINQANSKELIIKWNEVEHILSDKNNVYLYQNSKNAIILPRRLFKSQAEFDEFLQNIKEVHVESKKHGGRVK